MMRRSDFQARYKLSATLMTYWNENWACNHSRFFSSSTKQSAITNQVSFYLKPVLKKLHPDLFFRYQEAQKLPNLSEKSYADYNKECLHLLQDVWQKIFYIESLLPLPIFPVTEKQGIKSNQTLGNTLGQLNPNQKLTWKLPPSSFISPNLPIRCFFHRSVDDVTPTVAPSAINSSFTTPDLNSTHALPNHNISDVSFLIQIPKVFTSHYIRPEVSYLQLIRAFVLFFEQQKYLFESLHTPFPFMEALEELQHYLQVHSPASSSSSRSKNNFGAPSKASPTNEEQLLPQHKAMMEDNHLRHLSYKQVARRFTIYLLKAKRELVRQLQNNDDIDDDRDLPYHHTSTHRPYPTSLILQQHPHLLQESPLYYSTCPSLIAHQINYFFSKGHLRLQRVPPQEELPVLLKLQEVFFQFHDILHFDYRYYRQIFLVISSSPSSSPAALTTATVASVPTPTATATAAMTGIPEEEEEKKSINQKRFLGYSCKRYDEKRFQEYLVKVMKTAPSSSTSQWMKKLSLRPEGETGASRDFFIVKIPYDFHSLTLVDFLRTHLPIHQFSIFQRGATSSSSSAQPNNNGRREEEWFEGSSPSTPPSS